MEKESCAPQRNPVRPVRVGGPPAGGSAPEPDSQPASALTARSFAGTRMTDAEDVLGFEARRSTPQEAQSCYLGISRLAHPNGPRSRRCIPSRGQIREAQRP